MEIKSELKKPYSDNQRMHFIVEQNHRNGYTIEETDNLLLAWGLPLGVLIRINATLSFEYVSDEPFGSSPYAKSAS